MAKNRPRPALAASDHPSITSVTTGDPVNHSPGSLLLPAGGFAPHSRRCSSFYLATSMT